MHGVSAAGPDEERDHRRGDGAVPRTARRASRTRGFAGHSGTQRRCIVTDMGELDYNTGFDVKGNAPKATLH